MSRAGHRLLGGFAIAVFVFEGEIIGHLVVDAHRARGIGVGGLDERRQILVFDVDEFGGVLRDVLRLGDDERHRLADKTHAFMRKRIARRHAQRGAADAFEERHGRQALPAGSGDVGAGQNAEYAGHGARLFQVDADDLGVRAIAA